MANNYEYIIDKKIVNNGMAKKFFNLNYITIVKTYFPVLKTMSGDNSLDFKLLTSSMQNSLKGKYFYELALMDKTRKNYILLRHIDDLGLITNISNNDNTYKKYICKTEKTLPSVIDQLKVYQKMVNKKIYSDNYNKVFLDAITSLLINKSKISCNELLLKNSFEVDGVVDCLVQSKKNEQETSMKI